jgi:ribonuclease Z
MIECVLLGTGGMMPMPNRFLVSLAVRLEGQTLLFDCGEGTQIPLKIAKIGIKPIRRIFISHLHADHVTGLPGLLMMLNQAQPDGEVTVYGPRGIAAYVRAQEKTLAFERDYPLAVVELGEIEGVAYAEEKFEVVYRRLRHRTKCMGYAVVEKPRAGRFQVETAVKLGVPEGPQWGRLQHGESVRLNGGKIVTPEMVLGPRRPGRRIAFITDTKPCPGILELARDADLVFIEGMFDDSLEGEAGLKGHQTASQAAIQVRAAGAKRAVLIHVSPRYNDADLEMLLAQAMNHFDQMAVGRDLDRFELQVKG